MPHSTSRACSVIATISLFIGAASAQTAASTAPSAEVPPVSNPVVRFTSDLRLREEVDLNREDDGGHDLPQRQRPRIRLRIGAEVQVAPALTVFSRLSTGNPADARSPYQTLGDGWGKVPLNLDKVGARFAPAWAPGLTLQAGKGMSEAFWRSAVYSELVLDEDVQPTGGVIGYASPPLYGLRFIASVGEFLLLEQADQRDPVATLGQAGAQVAMGEFILTVVGEGHFYWRLNAAQSGRLLANNAGNVTRDQNGDQTPDSYASNFRILHGTAEISYRPGRWAFVASGGILHNLRAATSDDLGWHSGVLASLSWAALHTLKAATQYQVIEREAVFTPFSQDDFLSATAFRGMIGSLEYSWSDRVSLRLWSLASSGLSPDDSLASHAWQFRSRLDITFKSRF